MSNPVDYTALKSHSLADLLPPMSKEEFKALTDDIRANGLRVPIVTYQDQILDGRHRYKAAMEARITLTEKDVVPFNSNGRDTPLKFVIGQNVNRRHLNESQRALIAANIANIKKGENQYSAKDGSIDLPTAAKMLNVSEPTVKRAKTFLDKAAPQLVEKIKQGTMRVSALTNDELKTFGNRAVAKVPRLQRLMQYVCEKGFEHHVVMTQSHSAAVLIEAFDN